MSTTIKSLEDILLKNLPDTEWGDVDLSDDDCIYRKFYFDYLSNEQAFEALSLFPNSKMLFNKYLAIKSGIINKEKISDGELVDIVKKYLSDVSVFLEHDNDYLTIDFIENISSIKVSPEKINFKSGENKLHSNIYGSISEYLIDELPDDDAVLLLYDWSLEKTRWATVSAYFLNSFIGLENSKSLDAAFSLWKSENSNSYWAENSQFSANGVVYCKASQ
ncbi:hypothetical protein [Pseudoalteromonas sp. S558]|uniref:hypothetical protein n=1 Tax=Pseudoalteromonas sp. S558 TaxID=2066515 RepID=UPI00110AF5C2|nr:hypothetical protein [Pseudoalteromonas sp. S558]TMO00644.1 hypothetical protein CWB66_15225 [Pseudoalteromonas sp. S558]